MLLLYSDNNAIKAFSDLQLGREGSLPTAVLTMGSYKYCCFFTRSFRTSELAPPPDLADAFADYSGGGDHLDVTALCRFLRERQGEETLSEADVESLLERHRRLHNPRGSKLQLLLDDFFSLLFSPELNPPMQSKVYHDMNAPLSHYFIYTGHNSYLTGNQLSSICSDVPIIKALERGVRGIELDVWPNSTKDDIIILHGRTLTSPVPLLKCLKSIKEHAFTTSPYPVIITIEDHLTAALQAKFAKIVTQVFGDMLYYPGSEQLEEFPSPEALKRRVILSTKPPKEYLESKSLKGKDAEALGDKKIDEGFVWGREVSDLHAKIQPDNKHEDSHHEHANIEDQGDEDDAQKPQEYAPPEYKRLIAIRAGKPKGPLIDALKSVEEKVRRISLSEQEVEKVAANHGADLVRFTQRNILRIYPKGIRIDSSNYNPFIGWMHGAQMVAFNMQGYGRTLWLMHGFYKANGGCGYVKKPDFLLKYGPENEIFNPKSALRVKKTLKVKVYMGYGWNIDFKRTHFDKFSPPDFYVKVGTAGVPADSVMKRTRTIQDNWAPVWNEEFEFGLTVPELALLRVEVHEYDVSDKDDFGGQTCLPVSELRTGFRAVALCDKKGTQFKSVKLLLRFQFV